MYMDYKFVPIGLKLRAEDLYVGKNLQSPLCLYTDAKYTLDLVKC